MKQENNFSGLQCLQILFSQYRRNVNFSALITVELQQKYLENQGEVLLALSNEQQLRAELLTDAEVLKTYAGPVLVRLKNDAWVLMANSRQFVSSETVTIIDPAVGSKQKTIAVPKSQLEERMSGAMIIFRNLAQVDAARHSPSFLPCGNCQTQQYPDGSSPYHARICRRRGGGQGFAFQADCLGL